MNIFIILKVIKSQMLIFIKILITLFNILLIFLLSQKNRIHHKIKNSNILIVRLDTLGDIFLSLQQAYEIKKKFNGSKLILICRKQYFDYIKSLDIFDEIIPLNFYFQLIITNLI